MMTLRSLPQRLKKLVVVGGGYVYVPVEKPLFCKQSEFAMTMQGDYHTYNLKGMSLKMVKVLAA